MTMLTRQAPRHGFAIVAVVVTLAFISFLMVTIARQNLAHRQYLVQREHLVEADWLARAGIELATSRLLADPTYSGETAAILEHAEVRIAVRNQRVPPDVLRITCEARVAAEGRGVTRDATRLVRRIIRDGKARLETVE
ncbi:MAG: hypothetical protein FJ271_24075 [Planctomycetes bacterium]|nr:hypothetical protein [Planctomycetota bacterium]